MRTDNLSRTEFRILSSSIAFAGATEKWKPAIAAASNEMQMPLLVPPFQFVTHRLRHSRAPSPANPGPSRVRHPEIQMQRQTQELINFYVNYRSGIICRRHSSIAAARIEEDNASRKGGPPARFYAFRRHFMEASPRFTFQDEPHGSGGFAKIMKGRDNILERDIAIKTLDPLATQFSGPEQERFRREARILARLSHPNIPAIYDVEFGSTKFSLIFQFWTG